MKKIYLLILLVFSAFTFGQATDLYFSKYGEGSSNNKFLEIYNGTGASVDMAAGVYSIEMYANGASTPTNTQVLTGTITSGDVYVLRNSSSTIPAIAAAADITSTTCNFNGDDAIVLKKNGVIIDVIGDVGVDPGSGWSVAGTTNATADRTLVRKSTVCSPNATELASFGTDTTNSEWIVNATDYTTGLGSFNGCNTSPDIAITAPANGIILSPETTNVDVTLSVSNFNVANGTGDGHIHYTINGGATVMKYDTNAISIPTTPGSYTVYVELVDNSHNPIVPAQNATVSFTVASYTNVTDLATLRSQPVNGYYNLLSAPVTTHVRPMAGTGMATRNQKYAEDATAGILIDDANGVLNGLNIAENESLSGLKGQLTSFSSVLQFVPLTTTGVTNAPASPVVPTPVSIADIVANPAGYKESQLVDLGNVAFSALTGTQFAVNTNYTISQGADQTTLRTIFNQTGEVDYIGTNTPGSANVIALITRNGTNKQVAVRRLADFSNLSVKDNNIAGLKVFPNPAKTNLFITSDSFAAKTVEIFNVLGAKVLTTQVNNSQVNVSSLKTGVYMVKITEEGKTGTVKLVIE